MFPKLKKKWHQLQRSSPGSRFRDRYDARHRPGRDGRSPLRRAAIMTLAFGFTVIGVVLIFFPGPAVLFFFLAAALLAEESRTIAGGLDWLELRIRTLWRRALSWWRGRSAAKSLALAIAACLGSSRGVPPLPL